LDVRVRLELAQQVILRWQTPRRHNDGMQQTAPRDGRAANGGVDAAVACSLTLAPAPLLIPVFCGLLEGSED
jgi:hypothetical protein